MRFHTNIVAALQEPSTWAGFAGIMTSLGMQLDRPYAITCFLLSAICSFIAIIIKDPREYKDGMVS